MIPDFCTMDTLILFNSTLGTHGDCIVGCVAGRGTLFPPTRLFLTHDDVVSQECQVFSISII